VTIEDFVYLFRPFALLPPNGKSFYLSSPPFFSEVRVTRSLVLYVYLLIVVSPFVLFLLDIVLSALHICLYFMYSNKRLSSKLK
jgi:hypothetical protein